MNDIEIKRDWSFEADDVALAFDRHVREQLPWYDLATDAMTVIVRHYLERGGLVYDLGCSTGNIGQAIAPILEDRDALIVPIDSSLEMVRAYHGPGTPVQADILRYDYEPFDVAVLFLTLMFVPVGRRHELIHRLYGLMRPGGCIAVFDKTPSIGGYVGTVMSRITLAGKLAAGVPPEEIVAKEMSLAGVQKPTPVAALGHTAVEWFRFGDFAGWIIE